jgi:hypothetical protein
MKNLLKLAIGAAVAGAVVSTMMKQQARRRALSSRGEQSTDVGPDSSYGANPGANPVADTNSVGNEQAQGGQQPQDWRGAQNVLDS